MHSSKKPNFKSLNRVVRGKTWRVMCTCGKIVDFQSISPIFPLLRPSGGNQPKFALKQPCVWRIWNVLFIFRFDRELDSMSRNWGSNGSSHFAQGLSLLSLPDRMSPILGFASHSRIYWIMDARVNVKLVLIILPYRSTYPNPSHYLNLKSTAVCKIDSISPKFLYNQLLKDGTLSI